MPHKNANVPDDLTFRCWEVRYHFRMGEPLRFPSGKAGNLLRGAVGRILKTQYPDAYARIFDPSGAGPSGIADAPRPFVLRVSHLEAEDFPAGGTVDFRVNIFEEKGEFLPVFENVFRRMASEGLGPGHVRAEWINTDTGLREISLAPEPGGVGRVYLSFRTPTELKVEGAIVSKPAFFVLFRRLRNRISTLRTLYGAGPLPVDFRGMGRRAETIELLRYDVRNFHAERLSRRTGQVHAIGGFVGTAEYAGDLGEFLPYLRAGQYTGVGRQTVWGKGEIAVDRVE